MRIIGEGKFYQYKPSLGGSIAFIILFILATALFSWQIWHAAKIARKKLQGPFMTTTEDNLADVNTDARMFNTNSLTNTFIPFFSGCGMEIIGYICRAKSSSDLKKLTPFIIQNVFLLIAPAFFAATIYMVFGRLLFYMGSQRLLFISPRFGTSFFVTGDIFSFLLQAAGGGLMASSSGRNAGSKLVTVGLFIQIAFFGAFIIMETRFTILVSKVCPYYSSISKKWLFLNVSLLLSSILIMVRSIIRAIESIQGYDGYIISHEYFLFVFDSLLMFLVVVSFCVASYYSSIFSVMVECRTVRLVQQQENGMSFKDSNLMRLHSCYPSSS